MKRRLERVPLPDEHGAEERAWHTVRAAYEEREPVAWPRKHARSLAFAAVGVAIVAAAVTPPGQSVVNTLRDAVGREKVVGVKNAHRELVRLPDRRPDPRPIPPRRVGRPAVRITAAAQRLRHGVVVAARQVRRRRSLRLRARRARAGRNGALGAADGSSASASLAGRMRATASRTSPATRCA